MAASTPQEAFRALAQHVPHEQRPADGHKYSIITIFVQVEEAFVDILETMVSETSCLAVLEASDASRYLHALPLYATIWQSEEDDFHRVITAVVDWRQVDGLVEEIHGIAESLEVTEGILIAVQNLAYSSGSLRQ